MWGDSQATRLKNAGRAKRRPKEENTRTHLIVPILEALEWDRYDIYCEFDVEEGGKVDVALFLSGKPVVFVEAKSFDTDFAPDGNEVKQALDYVYKQGVAWAILTNGRQWWVYDAFAKVPHQEKRILAVDLLQQGRERHGAAADLPKAMCLLTPSAVEKGELERFGRRVHCYRSARAILKSAPDKLVDMVAERAKLDTDKDRATIREILQEFAEHSPPPAA